MAIEKRRRPTAPQGFVWRVRYPDPHRPGRLLSKSFYSEKDARTYDALWRVEQRRGLLAQLDAGQQRLGDYLAEWFKEWQGDKAKKTKLECARRLDRHVLELTSREVSEKPETSQEPRPVYQNHDNATDRRDVSKSRQWGEGALAWLQLRQVSPRVIEDWKQRKLKAGIGPEEVKRALGDLQQILQRAVVLGDYPQPYNPVSQVKKPASGRQTRRVDVEEVLSVEQVERLRATFLAAEDTRSATIVSLMAYGGLRPGEWMALEARAVELKRPKGYDGSRLGPWQANVTVSQRASLGEIIEGAKSKRARVRRVPLEPSLARDLAEWVMAEGVRGPQLLFPKDDSGRPAKDHDYRNWKARTYRPAAKALGLPSNPYALRHTYVSLLFAAGYSPVEVAARAGHSPTVALEVYAAVVAAYSGRTIVIEDEIVKARRKLAGNKGGLSPLGV